MLSFKIVAVAIPCKKMKNSSNNGMLREISTSTKTVICTFLLLIQHPNKESDTFHPIKKTERLIKSLPRVKENGKTTTVVTTI